MCGILCIMMVDPSDIASYRAKALVLVKRIRHRGPDWSGIHTQAHAVLAHERLGVVDPESGHQPLVDEEKQVAVAVNGEIYNHKAVREELKSDYTFKTHSDCEVILPLYYKYGADFVKHLDGQFAFVLSDARSGKFIAARDSIGINPLYYGYAKDGTMWFASEMKAICDVCPDFHQFPPGHIFESETKKFKPFFKPDWLDLERPLPTAQPSSSDLRSVLISAVKKRLDVCDVPWGVLLSGGLDSSIIASIASRVHHSRLQAAGRTGANIFFPRMHTFSIGLTGSPDLAAARKVADFLQSIHHEYVFTVQEALDAVKDVIYHLETYDVTTVRASTPMYLMSRKIRCIGIKMVLSGEGADEILAGYLYFHKAPNAKELHSETIRKLRDLYKYDCLRANKAPMSWGLEARFPFLDNDFMKWAYSIDPTSKMSSTHPAGKKIEKDLLRRAFDDKDKPWLPASVLWRQKEQFSDGVGYNWIDSLKAYANEQVSDKMFAAAKHRFPFQTPRTKEAYFIRRTFEELFPQQAARRTVVYEASIACSTAKAVEWDEEFKKMMASNGEQSGRAVGVHEAAYKDALSSAFGIATDKTVDNAPVLPTVGQS